MQGVEFVDAEAMVIAFLNECTESPTSSKVPAHRPERFTRAWRTGGGTLNRVLDEPILTVTCSAADSTTASDDANRARHAFLHESTAMPLVRVTEVMALYYDPDPDTNGDRYSFNVRLRVRATRR